MTEKDKMSQGKLLGNVLHFLTTRGLFDGRQDPRLWVPLLLYLHKRGWLYASANKDGSVRAVACAYRIRGATNAGLFNLPKRERGHILYVPFYATTTAGWFSALRMLRVYMKHNKHAVREVVVRRVGEAHARRFVVKPRGRLVEVGG